MDGWIRMDGWMARELGMHDDSPVDMSTAVWIIVISFDHRRGVQPEDHDEFGVVPEDLRAALAKWLKPLNAEPPYKLRRAPFDHGGALRGGVW